MLPRTFLVIKAKWYAMVCICVSKLTLQSRGAAWLLGMPSKTSWLQISVWELLGRMVVGIRQNCTQVLLNVCSSAWRHFLDTVQFTNIDIAEEFIVLKSQLIW